jgi:hypothetical protein
VQKCGNRELYVAGLLTACIAFAAPFAISLLPDFDLWQIVYFLLLVPLAIFVWLIVGLILRTRRVWLTLFLFCVVTAISWKIDYFLRVHGRWLVLAASSKKQVLAQPPPATGQLRHLDWDGWGMFAQDTEVYLVNDPANATLEIEKTKDGLMAKSVPCHFWRAYRLEPHWYALVYFTSTGWDDCPS